MEIGQACVPNINAAERRQRLNAGVIGLVVGIVLLGIMVALQLNPWWRLALILPFLVSAMGFFQWQDHTCVAHVAKGIKTVDGKHEQVIDTKERLVYQLQANKIYLKSAISAVIITLIAVFLPI